MNHHCSRAAALGLAAVLTAASLTGCGATPEGYTYTEAMLDLYYENDPSAYMEMTGATEEEAAKLYDSAMNRTMSYFKTYYSVTKWDDATRDQCLALYERIYKEKAQYKVLSCTTGSTNQWTVTIETTPFNLFTDADEDYITYLEGFRDDYESGAVTYEDKDEYLMDYADGVVDVVEEHFDTADYGEASTMTITVTKNEDGTYELEENDKAFLDVAILPYPEVETEEETASGEESETSSETEAAEEETAE